MRKGIYYIFILLLVSCVVPESERWTVNCSIKNESGVVVRMKFYLVSNNELLREVTLPINEILEGDFFRTSNSPPYDSDDFSQARASFYASDSIVVVFDNVKKSSYYLSMMDNFSAPNDRNIFRLGNYQAITETNFLYVITSSDLDNAESCIAGCD